MTIFESIVLGVVQGLTEFIPVSSSGHLVILQELLSGASEHLFLESINIGTVLALLIFFRKKLITLIRDTVMHRRYTMLRNILLTSMPVGIAGLFLADYIAANTFFSSLTVVMVMLASVGVLMIVIERLPHLSLQVDGSEMGWRRALVIGIIQVFALIPGVSRSGSTIIAGRLMGLSPAAAAEYSFLASLPIMIAVTLKLFVRSSDRCYLMEHLGVLVVGNIAAFVVGILAIKFLMDYLQHNTLALFGWYRLALAAVIALILLLQ